MLEVLKERYKRKYLGETLEATFMNIALANIKGMTEREARGFLGSMYSLHYERGIDGLRHYVDVWMILEHHHDELEKFFEEYKISGRDHFWKIVEVWDILIRYNRENIDRIIETAKELGLLKE